MFNEFCSPPPRPDSLISACSCWFLSDVSPTRAQQKPSRHKEMFSCLRDTILPPSTRRRSVTCTSRKHASPLCVWQLICRSDALIYFSLRRSASDLHPVFTLSLFLFVCLQTLRWSIRTATDTSSNSTSWPTRRRSSWWTPPLCVETPKIIIFIKWYILYWNRVILWKFY